MVWSKATSWHRMKKSLTDHQQSKLERLRRVVWIFMIASFLGYVLEMLYCWGLTGYPASRQGVIYGPFNQIYGFGALAICLTVLPVSHRSSRLVFCVSAVTGGVVEYTCSCLQEMVFGTRSWDFSKQTLTVDGRTSLLFMAIWGMLGCIFVKWLYPAVNWLLERIPFTKSNVVCSVIAVFFLLNLLISGVAVNRWVERGQGTPPQHNLDTLLDKLYPDVVMEWVYPEMTMANGAVLAKG